MLHSEEVRPPLYKGRQIPRTNEVHHVNHIDRSFGSVLTRRWGLGILSLARLAVQIQACKQHGPHKGLLRGYASHVGCEVDPYRYNCAIMGNNWLARQSLDMKASTHFNA
jgi:hypothetical protein